MYRTIAKLPAYLQKYCVEQRADRYSARDHAGWRYIMRQSRAYFKEHAVPIYLEGLRRTGISVDRIPSIADMDAKLRDLGWGAVPVEGFIPPAAFLDFQARRILPIASDMRSVDHIHYTPAPDIVHEAAGHAPILADPEYSEYLQMYASMAQKAIFSKQDLKLYEAIRTLSDVKENPDSTASQVQSATVALTQATAAVKVITEASKVARMNWWTVEYGLIGSLAAPKIYGAGLLSSVGESQACLMPKVKKLRLTADCVETGYDITEPQPQLFVAEDINHLKAVLREFEQTLSYKRGGVYGLSEALSGATVTTTTLDSGIQISGEVAEYLSQADQSVDFVRWQGPVQLSVNGRELRGQSVAEHAFGFSTPLGRAVGLAEKPLRYANTYDLSKLGIEVGLKSTLRLTTGFEIVGLVAEILRDESQTLLAIKWRGCSVKRGEKDYFLPEWGDFDMAIGEAVTSVSGGPADPERYGSHDVGTAATSPARTSPFSATELAAFGAYQKVRELRDKITNSVRPEVFAEQVTQLLQDIGAGFPHEWLLQLELVELAKRTKAPGADDLAAGLERETAASSTEKRWLVQQGLALATAAD